MNAGPLLRSLRGCGGTAAVDAHGLLRRDALDPRARVGRANAQTAAAKDPAFQPLGVFIVERHPPRTPLAADAPR